MVNVVFPELDGFPNIYIGISGKQGLKKEITKTILKDRQGNQFCERAWVNFLNGKLIDYMIKTIKNINLNQIASKSFPYGCRIA